MHRCGGLQWIPSIDLEPAYSRSTTSHHTHLPANKADSRSRSRVSCNTDREESDTPLRCSIIDIINEFAPSHRVEMRDHDLFPSKARSQRWPLPKKRTTIRPSIWHTTQCITTPLDDADEHTTGCRYDCNLNMADLWQCATETLGIQPDDNDNDLDRKEAKDIPIAISPPPGCDSLLAIPDKAVGAGDAKAASYSSLTSETDIEYRENDDPIGKEASVSYTVSDMNCATPIPPPSHTNTSKLYEFLFDSVETDSDEDDSYGIQSVLCHHVLISLFAIIHSISNEFYTIR